ncbi:hypothetical protein [Rufibacter tibetensis]|uniref:hypothetical protein n=1 Tax=Rufibacter tibetensis TaxID=512763 RepID=UPI0012F914BA|nr:hypothetical protein [Rufibacter tibetensis]
MDRMLWWPEEVSASAAPGLGAGDAGGCWVEGWQEARSIPRRAGRSNRRFADKPMG